MTSTSDIKWHFPVDSTGKYSAFNNHDLERFKKGRYKSLTREVIQNSIDAKLKNTDPVFVKFELLSLPFEQFPDLDGLKRKIDGCAQIAPRDGSAASAVPWFQSAQSLLGQREIPVLKMSDRNTEGMAGPCVLGTPFFSFIKAMGNPTKRDATAAGGHGIGKRAPLLSSKLRTLMASTVYQDKNGDKKFLSQGFSLLISHEERKLNSSSIDMISHEGYWGYSDGCMPVGNHADVPSFFHRHEVGTDIYLLGFDAAKHWDKKILAHALTNFFAAFARGTLHFEVGGVVVNRENVGSLFAQIDQLTDFLEDDDDKASLRNSGLFFEALTGGLHPPYFEESREVLGMGEIAVKLLVREGLPQELCLIRKDMLILTELSALRRFPNYKDFVAVIECKSELGEKLLRSIEPSRHDSLEFDQLENEGDRKDARAKIKRMSTQIREAIKKHALETNVKSGSVDFLSQFLADEDSQGPFEAGDRDPKGRITIAPRKLHVSKVVARGDTPEPDPDPRPDPSPDPVPTPPPPPPPPPPVPGPKMNLAKKTRVIEKPDGGHLIAFSLDGTDAVKVSIYAVGLEADHKLKVLQSNIGSVDQGDIIIGATGGQTRIIAHVILDRQSSGAYRIICRSKSS